MVKYHNPLAAEGEYGFFYDQNVKNILKLLISVVYDIRKEIGRISPAEI